MKFYGFGVIRIVILEVKRLKQREARSLEGHMITKGSPAFTFRAGRGPGPNTSSAVMRGHSWFGEKSLGQVSVAQSCLTLRPRGL